MLSKRRGVVRGRSDRGGPDKLKESIRRNREVKYYVRATRTNLYPRLAFPVLNDEYVYQTFSGFDPIDISLDRTVRPYVSNGGIIGNSIHIKRITVNINASVHLISAPPNDNTRTNKPVFSDTPEALQHNDCILRVSLIRSRVPFLPFPTSVVEMGVYDRTYFLQPTELIANPLAIPTTNYSLYDYMNDLLPFDPASVDVLDDQFIPVQTNSAGKSDYTPVSLKFTHSIRQDRTMKLKTGTNRLIDSDPVGKFYIFTRLCVLSPFVSPTRGNYSPEATMSKVVKVSYYDM